MGPECRLPEQVWRGYLGQTKQTIAIRCTATGVILEHNACAKWALGNRSSLVGKKLSDLVNRVDREELDLEGMAGRDECGQLALKAKRSGSVLHSYFTAVGAELLLIADVMGEMEDVAEQLGRLVNEISDMGRDLRQRNRELQEANRKITNLSRTDPLTALANRRHLMERLVPALAMSRRHHLPLCLFMADLDHFKNVNDTHGHEMGDRVLVTFADLLREQCREEDLPCRFGGEEMLVMLPTVSATSGAAAAERVRSQFAERTQAAHGLRCTASFGVAEAQRKDTPDSLIARADKALYAAKGQGRNRVVTA